MSIDTLMEEMPVVLENKRFCFCGNDENFCTFSLFWSLKFPIWETFPKNCD